jgi:hypothetical protein
MGQQINLQTVAYVASRPSAMVPEITAVWLLAHGLMEVVPASFAYDIVINRKNIFVSIQMIICNGKVTMVGCSAYILPALLFWQWIGNGFGVSVPVYAHIQVHAGKQYYAILYRHGRIRSLSQIRLNGFNSI